VEEYHPSKLPKSVERGCIGSSHRLGDYVMNTPAKPPLRISAKCLGPVILLDGELAPKNRNLIFARNGTGKSFLSRAFRYLDLYSQSKPLTDAARNLVSDEAPDGKGEFAIARGAAPFGTLKLNKSGDVADASVTDTIFHVFSEDFVHEELREQQYKLDGETENQIAVDSSNIKLTEAMSALSEARAKYNAGRLGLELQLSVGKEASLCKNAAIKKSLKEFSELTLDAILSRFTSKPSGSKRSSLEVLQDLEALKAIPSVPNSPQPVDAPQAQSLDLEHYIQLQKKITSPSSVAEVIKEKINKHTEFFRTGTEILRGGESSVCPFCEQDVTLAQPQAVIDTYVKYFADEEQKHKDELRTVYKTLDRIEANLKDTEKQLLVQKSRYDDLNRLLPSRKDDQLDSSDAALAAAVDAIKTLKAGLISKANALSVSGPLPDDAFVSSMVKLKELIEFNNRCVLDLNRAVHNSDSERKRLQREMCEVFAIDFAVQSWGAIEDIRSQLAEVVRHQDTVVELEKHRPSANSKTRAAKTFELLLRAFFGTKYIFDKESFTLRRGDKEMARGIHRTMSDGEKSAIAFCYFVASIHHKVKANEDYRKLFLIFDDPVTSMSYDYVFAIAQTLKFLAISSDGEVSLDADRGGADFFGPELLILTHSSYFFNISIGNKVVDPSAAFALHPDVPAHRLAPLRRYIAPFHEHLRDIWAVSKNARDPDHRTGNAIRSVLEAVGRFCRPDKSTELTLFIQYLTSDCGFQVKSVLINSLSHGTYYDEVPSPDDLKVACVEAIEIVEKFAPGQIELVKAG
jgi:wobble nucleotide-excising tRNase